MRKFQVVLLLSFICSVLLVGCGLPQEANTALTDRLGDDYTVLSSKKGTNVFPATDEEWCVVVEYNRGSNTIIANFILLKTGKLWQINVAYEDNFLRRNCTNYDKRGY